MTARALWHWVRDDLMGRVSKRLPKRVRVELARRQENAEVLISVFQLVVAVLFTLVYFASPKPVDAPDFEPVPIALGAYTAFSVLRLFLTYRRICPAWFLWASVFVDVAVVIITLGSFNTVYGGPEFSLKSPSILYLFILIAIRMLRFDPRFVLGTGVVAALGWGMLCVTAVWVWNFRTTHDYSEYITGVIERVQYEGDLPIGLEGELVAAQEVRMARNNGDEPFILYKGTEHIGRFLLGAEIEKIFHILMVTIMLVIAQSLARRTLVNAVAHEAASQELSRFFPPAIAEQIASSDASITAGKGEVRHASILTMDLRGFTPLTRELPPSDVMALLTEYQARLVPVIHQHGGSVDKFLGDGILATFGAALETDTYAADVLRAVEDLREAVVDWNAERRGSGQAEVNVGMAVACGPVIFGAVGDENRLEYTVIGDAVNLAAKLEKQTKAEQCQALTTLQTLEQALAQGYEPKNGIEKRPQRDVGGVNEPVDLVVLVPG